MICNSTGYSRDRKNPAQFFFSISRFDLMSRLGPSLLLILAWSQRTELIQIENHGCLLLLLVWLLSTPEGRDKSYV